MRKDHTLYNQYWLPRTRLQDLLTFRVVLDPAFFIPQGSQDRALSLPRFPGMHDSRVLHLVSYDSLDLRTTYIYQDDIALLPLDIHLQRLSDGQSKV